MTNVTARKPMMTGDLGRLPRGVNTDVSLAVSPHNLEAEQAVLGAILLDGSMITDLARYLDPEHFYKTGHGTIYQAMLELGDHSCGIDNITLADHLGKRGVLSEVGGAAYLAELISLVSGTTNVAHHASIVIEKAKLRRLQASAIEVCHAINSGADLDRAARLLPDPATLQPVTTGSVAALEVVTASSFLEEEDDETSAEWVWDDMVALGSLVGVIAKPKCGKSTLTYELAVKVALGLPFLGRSTKSCAVLILAPEEIPRDIKRRLRSLAAGRKLENIHLKFGFMDANEITHAQIARTVEERSVGLIIVDTLNSFWKITDENDSAEVTKAIMPLLGIAREKNVAVIVIHHSRKSDGEYGDEIRGSGALSSLLDCAFILKRCVVENQRSLTAISRWSETPRELILELREHGYECIGDPASAGRQARINKVIATLRPDPQTSLEIANKAGVPASKIYPIMDALVREGRAQRIGMGKRGSPFQFTSPLINEGREETKSVEGQT